MKSEWGGKIMRDSTLRQLRAFSAVARHHSVVRAAGELHLTASAVSLQIKDLEQAVGLPLFARFGRILSLTPAGDVLLIDVNRALLALKDADEALNRLCGSETGIVSVGMVSNAKYFLPRMLAHFHGAHPEVKLRVSSGNLEQLLRQLESREVDFAIMGEPPEGLQARSEAFAPHPLGILASPGHRLAERRRIAPAALDLCDFIVRERGSVTRAAMDRFFDSACIAPPRVMELTSNEAIKQAVMGDMGLTFLSLHTAGLEVQEKALIVLDVVGLPLMHSWYVVDLPSRRMSNAAASLRQYIVKDGGNFIAQQFQCLDMGLNMENRRVCADLVA